MMRACQAKWPGGGRVADQQPLTTKWRAHRTMLRLLMLARIRISFRASSLQR